MNNMDSMNNELMSIPEENIFLEFLFEDELYSVLSKEETIDEGDEVYFAKVKFVDDVKISYFEQEHHFDNPNITPLEEIHNLYPKLEHKEIRSLLARCGLRGDLAMQPIKTLSGGEQSKLKLCKVMMVKSNVLVLDEPTNHLDANARMDLLDALKKYQGTIIFVSHEKEFIDKLATEIYSFEDLLLS
jgi:ATPase subunit of ABC transporter with duplicated ATPase domains